MDDRANIGRSEVILGKALKGKRDDVVITSKVASPIGDGPNDQGLSRYHIMREVEKSLTRLDTDHIDVYLVHTFDELTPLMRLSAHWMTSFARVKSAMSDVVTMRHGRSARVCGSPINTMQHRICVSRINTIC